MRAAIYARVSSAAQRDAHTIENQLRTLPAFVAAQGWTLTGTYVDDGRSAKTGKLDKREGFSRLLADAAVKAFDVLVVVDIDRLSRTNDMIERAAILGPFQRAGIEIVTPSGGRFDLDSMIGGLYVDLQARFAAEENRKRAERIKAGKLRAIAEGRKPAGPTPYGLTYDRASGTWSIDPVRAGIVREIYQRVISGESCMVIADDLHARNVPPPRGPWERHKVWVIARSRYTVGEWTADKARRLTMPVPAILDETTWHAAQAKLIEHGKRGLRKTKHVYLLEGIAVCGLCGSPMAIRSPTRNPQRTNGNPSPAAYVCRARKIARIGEQRCAAPIVPVADVDARVWAEVEAKLFDPDVLAEVQRRSEARAANRRDWAADVITYKAHLVRLAKAEAGMLKRYSTGSISDEGLDLALAGLKRERAGFAAQLEHAQHAATARDVELEAAPAAWLEAMRGLAVNASPEARQRIVSAIVEPGAVFNGLQVSFTLAVEEASRDELASAAVLVVVPGLSTQPRDDRRGALRLRLVA